jgi:deoxyadenosine/deoxycytidine kinase
MKKNDFIILIGSDGAGKSTIAEALSNALGYPVEHHGPVKSYEEGKAEYFGDIERIDYSVIKDRFHEGEKIFAPIYRGYEADYFDELEKQLVEKFNVMLVLVRPPYYIIEDRLIERGEDFVKKEDWGKAYDAVNTVYHQSSLPKITIDTNQYTVEQNVKQIIAML